MTDLTAAIRLVRAAVLDLAPELHQGLDNLRTHKLRSLLTMLGMIFGVAAVVAMLSIGAGARQEVIAFIEQLGVRNIIVEARETRIGRRCRRSGSSRRACRSRIFAWSRRTSAAWPRSARASG